MKYLRFLGTIILIGILINVFPGCLIAQGSSIDNGVDWLIANQDSSGLWGTDKATPFRDATVIVDVLGKLGADSAIIELARSAIDAQLITSTDYLARKIIAKSSIGAISVLFVDSLANMQNDDGGWAYQEGYGSNVLETALTLRALKSALYSNMTKLGMGVNYLSSQQNADSGWTFVASDSSQVFYTAHVIITLSMLEGDFSVSNQIQGAVNWLKTQIHGDGGFGTGGVSNPYETGLALASMIKGDPTASEITDAWNYLETTQLDTGSWNDDAYSTAVAIYGLNHVGPDLAVYSSDITLSNPTPTDSELVTISVTIYNQGALDADSILVRIFDNFMLNNDSLSFMPTEQIGPDMIISSLLSGEDTTVQVVWNTFELGGDHYIMVEIDPLDEISEPEKLNNIGKKFVHVYFPPDLVIDYDGIVFIPAEPDTGDIVVIRTIVKNMGEITATNIPLQIWDGDPDAGGIPLLSPPYDTIPSITPGSEYTLNLDMGYYFDTAGAYPIYACADKDNEIREINEYNNCNFDTLWIGPQPYPVGLYTGLNLLGLPSTPSDNPTSYTMIPQIPNCNEIDGWDRVSQMWISAVDIGGGVIIGDEFPIELQDGFFARVTDAGGFSFFGRSLTEHGCTHLEGGLNMASVPNSDACYTAYSLIDDINTCVEAHMWDRVVQGWVSAAKIGEGVFIGEDFSVTRGNGYFLRVGSAGDWCTRTCDTITILPDLLVTPDDIILDPNPVPSGDTVGIWVNINNVGTDTAFSPRLDIYMGDPDAGGTPMAGADLPVDIPPGGASGFYGSKFVFEGSGFVDIYGIADYYNTIEELDETNNRAYKTLQVTATIFAGNTQNVSDEKSSEIPIATLSSGSEKTLKHNPELIPAPVYISSPASAPKEEPITIASAKTTSFSEVTKIENVITGNHTSSSVTISWVTDGLADGCINYGTDKALGLTKCEDGEGSEMHLVALDDLSENTSYYFEIVSGGISDDNQGNSYSFTTTMSGAGVPAVIYGRVNKAGSNTAVGNIIVSGRLRRGEINSYPLIGLTNPDGIWVLNLGNLKSPVSSDVLPYETGDTIFLQFQGGSRGIGADTIVILGTSPQNCGVQEIEISTQVEEPIQSEADLLPDHYYVSSNYPNPFNLSTTIKFGLPVAGYVELSIYNILGQKVITLLNEYHQAGNHVVTWNGRNADGQIVSSGIYFYRLKSREFTQIRKMLLLK